MGNRLGIGLGLLSLVVLVLCTVSCSTHVPEADIRTFEGPTGYTLSYDSNQLMERADDENDLTLAMAYRPGQESGLVSLLLVSSKKNDTGLDFQDLLVDLKEAGKKLGGSDISEPKLLENSNLEVGYVGWTSEEEQETSRARIYLAYDPNSGLTIRFIAIYPLRDQDRVDEFFNPIVESVTLRK